jgi:anti-sigma B factor antagonist
MQLRVEESGGVTTAVLNGRMDIEGAHAVDMQFNVIAGSKKKLVIDMAGVSFLASMGLRTIMTCVRSITSKGGKVAIAGPQPGGVKTQRTVDVLNLGAELAHHRDEQSGCVFASGEERGAFDFERAHSGNRADAG